MIRILGIKQDIENGYELEEFPYKPYLLTSGIKSFLKKKQEFHFSGRVIFAKTATFSPLSHLHLPDAVVINMQFTNYNASRVKILECT